ncbi:calmodulin-dependent protein kinase [Gigaspora margarita]|uniref:Calmodulin-dependent protein kinase n=1 Tax=Gigaspora margarita TaxID=4874 RepID=A0A8H4A1H1_GIGMA|nr:calmodulin-dependent protein kinase [Gigaspora margarita]
MLYTLYVINGKRETPIDGTPVYFMNIYFDAWDGDPNLRSSIAKIYNITQPSSHHPTENEFLTSAGTATLIFPSKRRPRHIVHRIIESK